MRWWLRNWIGKITWRQLFELPSFAQLRGIVMLMLAVSLWTATALMLQELFLKGFPRPLFSTLVQSACPVILLLKPATAAAWHIYSKTNNKSAGMKSFFRSILAGIMANNSQTLTVERCLSFMRSPAAYSLSVDHLEGKKATFESSSQNNKASSALPVSQSRKSQDSSLLGRTTSAATLRVTNCNSCCCGETSVQGAITSEAPCGNTAAIGSRGLKTKAACENEFMDISEAVAKKEFDIRRRSIIQTVPLAALWLVAQLAYDASLPCLSVTSNCLVQSTSVFFCYGLAIIHLNQPLKRSAIACLVVLAGGVCLIVAHLPASANKIHKSDGSNIIRPAVLNLSDEPNINVDAHIDIGQREAQNISLSGQMSLDEVLGTLPLKPSPTTADGNKHTQEALSITTELVVRTETRHAGILLEGPDNTVAPIGGKHELFHPTENINGNGESVASDSITGFCLCFLAAAGYAVHTIALKSQEAQDPGFGAGLVYGFMGLWVMLSLPAITLFLHVFNLEPFLFPDIRSWIILLACGVIGTAVADICWGRAVLLLNPVVASAASNVQVPMALALDSLLIGRSFDAWYFTGTTAIVAAVVAVTCITMDMPRQVQHCLQLDTPPNEVCELTKIQV